MTNHIPEVLTNEATLPLVLTRAGETRIDSRLVASMLDIENRALLQNIDNYLSEFQAFGVVTFQTKKPPRGSKGGMPARIALLNEDQAYFAVALSRNTAQVVRVKFELVKAFREARKSQQAKQTQYLPFLHVAHDAARKLAKKAQAEGSHAPEHVFHSNIERLINKAFGIEAGQRDNLTAGQRNQISSGYQIVGVAIGEVLSQGGSQEAAYQEAKRRIGDFAKLFAPVREVAA